MGSPPRSSQAGRQNDRGPRDDDRDPGAGRRRHHRRSGPPGAVLAGFTAQLPAIAAAVLLTAFCLALLWLRAVYAGHLGLRFLVWNLFLACVPVMAAAVASPLLAARRLGALAVLASGLWLVFLPNGPYLVTDLLHLAPSAAAPYWFDTIVYGAFACTGVLLGVVSLALVQHGITLGYGRVAGWATAVATSGLCGVGVYLGRFRRWNSWDVLGDPRRILSDVAFLAHPRAGARAWAVSIVVGLLFFAAHAVVLGVHASLGALGRSAPRT